jgi:molybdopterin synthase sulfur carrier subunit
LLILKLLAKKIMQVNVLLFGITKDLVGKQKFFLELPGEVTVAEFKRLLKESYPELQELNSLAVAVNSEYAIDGNLIRADDEIALIPPVSGG